MWPRFVPDALAAVPRPGVSCEPQELQEVFVEANRLSPFLWPIEVEPYREEVGSAAVARQSWLAEVVLGLSLVDELPQDISASHGA